MYFQIQRKRPAKHHLVHIGKGVSQKFVTGVRIQGPAAACIFKFNPRGRVLVRPRASALPRVGEGNGVSQKLVTGVRIQGEGGQSKIRDVFGIRN